MIGAKLAITRKTLTVIKTREAFRIETPLHKLPLQKHLIVLNVAPVVCSQLASFNGEMLEYRLIVTRPFSVRFSF